MNAANFRRLWALTPVEAVRAWLQGEFGIGDEPALLEAIRRDSRIKLSDDEITDYICEAWDSGLGPEDCLERFAALSCRR